VTRVGGKDQVVISSGGTVDGYDAATGQLLWSHAGLSGNQIPSVTVQGDRVYVGADLGRREKGDDSAAASNCCLRIVPGSAAGYEVVWKAKRALSHYVSPLVHRGHAYYLSRTGVLYCLDAKTGAEVYAERTSGPCWAQPIAAGDHIYLFHKDGQTTVVKAGPRFEPVTRNRLWKEDAPPLPGRSYEYEPQGPKDPRPRKPEAHYMDPIVYGVAAVDGAIYVRIGTALYRVGGP
jgi:outer membrane protein assembly factor BamB